VSRGPVLVSFFHTVSVSELRNRVKAFFFPFERPRHATTLPALREDARLVGLRVVAVRPLLRFVRRQWFVLLARSVA
jgi:hypothetical protein